MSHLIASRDRRTRDTGVGLALACGMIVAYMVIHLGAIFLVAPSWAATPWLAALILVQAWLSTGLFITAHDAMHGSLAPGRPTLNRTIGRLCLMIYAGLDYDRMLPAHFDHHRHVGSARDPDFNDRDPRRAVPWLVSFFRGYYTHAQLARITIVATLYLLLGASLFNIVLFWAVPALMALVQLFYYGTYLPHRHEREGGFVDHHRTRSVAQSRLLSLVTCFNFGGYHHEHHLHPGVPWWRLPSMRG